MNALTTVVPADNEVKIPSALIVATAVFDDSHVTAPEVAVSKSTTAGVNTSSPEPAKHTLVAPPVISATGSELTVTATVACEVQPAGLVAVT